ncbi:MAG: hypothetical protein FJX92_03360 [Bacteroidetes bacterium]|nr:hypothetical protein [Bacteroidota bacterium]
MRITSLLLFVFFGLCSSTWAQKPLTKQEERKQRINQLIRQAEEGTLVYNHHHIFGIQVRSLGYGMFYEYGRMKNPRKTNIFRLDLTEIKDRKEDKVQNTANGFIFFGNPYIYGKVNNFYQANLGFGQQVVHGQKGNKNGVSVTGVYSGGLALGLLRPYYLQIIDPVINQEKFIKYSAADSALFLGNTILGGGGLSKGWNEMKFRPGLFARTALRFDYGRFNEAVSGIELGVTAEYYTQKISIIAGPHDRQFFFQGYIALLFGRRK